MPTKRSDQPGIEDLIAEEIERQAKDFEENGPAVLGRPPGAKLLTDEEELRLWNYRDPNVNIYDLQAQGMPDTEISRMLHPPRFKLIERAGSTRAEQAEYAERMAKRAMQAAERVRSQEDPAVVDTTARDVPAAMPMPSLASPQGQSAQQPAPLSMAQFNGGQ